MSTFQSLCQNAIKDETVMNQLINNQFINFFSQFKAFLETFQLPNSTKHPYQGTFKRKRLLGIFDEVLNNVGTIISKTARDNYLPQMKFDIKEIFTCLLHPETPDRIRQKAIPIFFSLIDKLGDHSSEMLLDVSRFVFDFYKIKDECPRESNFDLKVDSNKCIYIPEQELTKKDQFKKNMNDFQSLMTKSQESEYSLMFPFFKKMFLVPSYERLINKNSTFGIAGYSPEFLHKINISILIKSTEFPGTFKLVSKDSLNYFVEAAIQSSTKYAELDESRSYVLRFYETLSSHQNRDILKSQPISLVNRAVQSLLEMIQSLITKKQDCIVAFYEKALKFFQLCLSTFEKDRKALATQLINWSHPESLHQALIILLTSFVNVGIKNLDLWGLLKQPNKETTTFLSTLSVFSSYFALSISETLLKFTLENISSAINIGTSRDVWTGKKNNPMMKNFISEKRSAFFIANKRYFAFQDSIPYLYPIEGDNWQPFVETIKNMNFENIEDPDIQSRTYLVGSSFVYPLASLITRFPPQLEYSVTFIIENFLDWLKDCLSMKKQNSNIIQNSLYVLGLIFSSEACIRLISTECCIDWVLTLQHYINCNNSQIKTTALKRGCKAIYKGILGSSTILNDDIVATLLAANKKSNSDFKKIVKNQLPAINSVDFINIIDTQYQANYLFRILIESVYNSDGQHLDQIVTSMIEILTQNTRMIDIYTLWPITLFLKEMKNLNEDAVDRLILELISSIQKVDQAYGEVLLLFICDLIVYSSSTKGIEKFKELPDEYKPSHIMLNISRYFNNLSFPSYETNKLDKQFFTNGHHEILQFYDQNKISSHLSVGHFAYQFNQYSETEFEEFSVPDPSKLETVEMQIPNPSNYEFQSNFENSFSNFFKDDLFSPSSFNIQSNDESANSSIVEFPENYSQKLIDTPKNYGLQAAAFASSTGIEDPISSSRFVPCGFPTFNVEMNISYKRSIEVGIRIKKETSNFKRFEKGLGIEGFSQEAKAINYKDCRHEIKFIVNSTSKPSIIEIIWNSKASNFFFPETRAQIQITEMDDSFLVETLFNHEVAYPDGLYDAVVSLNSLPAFIISKVLTIQEIIEKKTADEYKLAADKLKNIEEENFPQRSQMYSNEKALLFV